MRAKRKLLISMLAIVFVLLAVVATIAIAFALTQQTITTTLNIGYVVEDIDGTASATYTIGGVTESLTAMKGDQVIGDTLVFHAGDTEDAGNLMFPEGQIPLSAQNDNIVIQYTYSNTGAKHYIASMSFDSELVADNMKVEYSINGTDYSTNRYAVVVPANTSNRSYWIKISIENKAKSASFTGDFKWLLSGCDEQEDSYLSLTSVEMQSTGTAGSYQVSMAGDSGYVGELVFPREVNGDAVTTIVKNDNLTQEQKNQVTSVYIPNSVTKIDSQAFRYYQNLQTVAFEQNETGALSVQSGGINTINSGAFMYCDRLKEITIPSTTTTIGSYAFAYCNALTNIIIPDSVTSVPTYMLAYSSGLQSIYIGDGVTKVNEWAFRDCEDLIDLYIGKNVQSFSSGACLNCLSLMNITVDEENTTFKDDGNCLISISSGSVRVGCNNSVIPNDGTIKMISQYAFFGRKNLTSIIIPASVTSISTKMFSNCENLIQLEVDQNNTTYFSQNNCIIKISTKQLLVGCKTSVIPNDDTVTGIFDYAFYECLKLKEITIPSNITSIGGYAFAYSDLERIRFENANVQLGEYMFNNCLSLKDVVLPTEITSLPNGVFDTCTSLVDITIPYNITSIGGWVFARCSGLKSIIFERTSGWYITSSSTATSGTSVNVTSSNSNLIPWLTTNSSYFSKYWRCS